MTRDPQTWNSVYDDDTAPWVIGEPQPAVLAMERAGLIGGRVLDPGTGAGEHTIALTALGYDVLGVDFSPSALAVARANATAKGVDAKFAEVDMLALADPATPLPGDFDTVLDSALFHVFGTEPEQRADYVRGLARLVVPGGVVLVLALSDTQPGRGPRIPASIIRDSFTGPDWTIEDLTLSTYRGRGLNDEDGDADQLPSGEPVDTAAWQARVRRVAS
ncbi:class I SAM-dependent methyltransferase [Nocardia takedensis]